MEHLQSLANEIKKQRSLARQLEDAGWLKKMFKLSGARAKLEEMERNFIRELRLYLEKNDSQFKALAEENLRLLENPSITYKTVSYTFSPVGTYTGYFKGHIDDRGYAHCQLAKTNFGVYPLSQLDYVSLYTGKIDYLGYIELKASQISSALFYTRPRVYRGHVTKGGVIVLKVDKTQIEMISGHVVIGKLIGLHFADDNDALVFNENRRKMLEMINILRRQLLDE